MSGSAASIPKSSHTSSSIWSSFSSSKPRSLAFKTISSLAKSTSIMLSSHVGVNVNTVIKATQCP